MDNDKLVITLITAVVAFFGMLSYVAWESEGMKHTERMELIKNNPACVIIK